MTNLTRRQLLQVGAQAMALSLLPAGAKAHPLLADLGRGPAPIPPITDPDVKELAMRAVEASHAAGADYADVRLTHTYLSQPIIVDATPAQSAGSWVTDERMQVGVRTLVNGYWGFAASGIWTRDEMARLGQAAVHQAKINALGKPRPMALAPVPVVKDRHWAMPVKLDPFLIDPALIYDVLTSMKMYFDRYKWKSPNAMGRGQGISLPPDLINRACFYREAKAFASTEGSFCTQQLYRSWGEFGFQAQTGEVYWLDTLSPTGVGFELYRDQDLETAVFQFLEAADADLDIPWVPIEVGRYDMVFDARATAALVNYTLGRATELDRAMGYEANAGGTSYINDPLTMVGSYQAAAPEVTLRANRSEPGGCATVQWDDEGTAPAAKGFALVQDGVLTDYPTTRESATWLQDYDRTAQRPVQSQGCAAAESAIHAPLLHTPNLELVAGPEAQDFDALVGTLKKGVALKSWGKDIRYDMDFQCLNGYGGGPATFYQVENGRCVTKIKNPALLFRAPELWKGILGLGGAASRRRYGLPSAKGEPAQQTFHSVTVPPIACKQLALVDITRKA